MAEATQVKEQSAAALGVAFIRGKLTNTRKANGKNGGFMAVIAIPAADEWSMPGAVQVWSANPLGEAGAMVSVKVRLSGIPKTFKLEVTDPETGEVRTRKGYGADNLLSAVEA